MTTDTQLPSSVRDFMTAYVARDVDTASALLTDDAVVVDQQESFRGRAEIRAFLRDAGTEFEYTTEQTGTAQVDDDHWVVTVRLVGTFPGGVADLDHRFTLRGAEIAEVVITSHVP